MAAASPSPATAAAWTRDETRIDPRIRAAWCTLPAPPPVAVPRTRAACLAEARAPAGRAAHAARVAAFSKDPRFAGLDQVAPTAACTTRTLTFVSQPDGNAVAVSVVRAAGGSDTYADTDDVLLYFHGGGMAKGSALDGNHQTLARLVAAYGITVVLVNFRNSIVPAREGDDIAPFPGGLNDCVSAVRWVRAGGLGNPSESAPAALASSPHRGRLVVAGESGGGNLAIATGLMLTQQQQGDGPAASVRIDGIYAMCPFIGGVYPNPKYASSSEFDGIMLTSSTLMTLVRGYCADGSDDANDLLTNNPLAWPDACSEDDVKGLPEIVVSVNEFDPLRDEGLAFYRKCLRAGVKARAKVLCGTVHATDNFFPGTAPDVARATARDMAGFCLGDTARL